MCGNVLCIAQLHYNEAGILYLPSTHYIGVAPPTLSTNSNALDLSGCIWVLAKECVWVRPNAFGFEMTYNIMIHTFLGA